jgi:lysophospholipase L1-like esterase
MSFIRTEWRAPAKAATVAVAIASGEPVCQLSRVKQSLALPLALLLAAAAPVGVHIAPATSATDAVRTLPARVGGRALNVGTAAAPRWQRQWPGTYFETAFAGSAAGFKVGPGDVILNVIVDGRPLPPLVKPSPRRYRIEGLALGRHVVRVEIATENQSAPTAFDGFYAGRGTRPLPVSPRPRQIEFIGDSHTVGYGNTSPTRACTGDEVWATTDASQGPGPLAARRYGADYQVNAISGRGVVRSYNGAAVDPLPAVYPFILFDKAAPYRDPAWRPQVIVIALGTNDFSTPLHPGEKWASRGALHADFEASYVRFVQGLRARNPHAFFILWTTDMAEGEIASEVQRVVARLRASGERRITFVPVTGLALSACNYHPSLADDRKTAETIERAIGAQSIWTAGDPSWDALTLKRKAARANRSSGT